MRNKKIYKSFIIPLFLLFILSITLGFIGDDKRGNRVDKGQSVSSTNQTGKVGDAFRFNINNLNIPINRVGVIAAVNIPPDGTLGRYGNSSFLFSSGFIMTGYTSGNLWGFAQATASLIENMTPGTVASGPNDPDAQMYVVKREDPAFGQSWQDWKIAVDKFGADFYDGDGDGVYNPVDKNGNGEWDPDEDFPDLIGDVTAWCVYTDGIPAAQRLRFPGIAPQGVEIRQTVFAFASKGALGNIMFIRYRISNSGLVADQLDSVYFSVWADPDLGDHEDDLVGVDVSRNAGFVYNSGPDAQYGPQVPCFMIDFFSGPAAYIAGETYIDVNGNGVYDDGTDTPLDTAFTNRGQVLGIEVLPGARNLDISSFVHYQQSDPTRGDPNNEFQARFYSLGELPLGGSLDPCTDPLGQVRGGVNCSTIDPRFWYSGDPVTDVGWINTRATDQRQMTNVGPFTLRIGDEKEITVAYVVGQGSNALNSITVARGIDDGAQFIFDNNFKAPVPPDAIVPEVVSGPDFIDFIFNAKDQVTYQDITDAWDNRFHGINVYAYRTNSTQDNVGGTDNSMLYTSYQVDNFIQNVLKENPETGGREMLYPEAPQKLNPQVFADPDKANIRVRVTRDPFTGSTLVKGKPYYFAFTSTAINYDALAPMDETATFGTPGDYYLSSAGFVAEVENVPRITRVVLGEDIYSPPTPPVDGNKLAGGSAGKLQYDVVDKEALTGDKYSVTFEVDSSVTISPTAVSYAAKWNLTNTTTNTTIIEGSKDYLFGSPVINVTITDGFIAKVSNEVPDLADAIQVETTNDWANANFFYLGRDLGTDSKRLTGGGSALTGLSNTFTRADKIRRVELRFDVPGKAYRYLNGFLGTAPPFRRNSYVYAEGVVAGAPGLTDPILAEIGQIGVGFVDVPFTAWVEDEAFGEMRQLAVGFIERKASEGGNPDGAWDPGINVNNTGEFIFIFNSTYDPNGGQQVYKGFSDGTDITWADIKGYTVPASANASDMERLIAASPFFDVLYAVGLSKKDSATFFSSTDKFIIEVENYPYTPEDVFEFQTRQAGALTAEEEKALFDKVTVFPNPLYGFNVATSYSGGAADEPFVTFSNLPPDDITIKVYSLSGQLLRTLGASDRSSLSSPFLRWDLLNESGLRVASGMYLAIVSSPKFGEKVLKFAIIMPQKQIQKY
ncbi:MAG: hypothetical protein KGZ85_16230 [Ignavibacterium sp.]|nr:hypothetical protein [Ignavibacterium sp.]